MRSATVIIYLCDYWIFELIANLIVKREEYETLIIRYCTEELPSISPQSTDAADRTILTSNILTKTSDPVPFLTLFLLYAMWLAVVINPQCNVELDQLFLVLSKHHPLK